MLIDGAKQQLRDVRKIARELDVDIVIVLDLVYALEYCGMRRTAFTHPAVAKPSSG